MANSKSASNKKPYAPPNLHIGTSGFSYADWVGPYYPPGTPASKFFEYYALEFDCLEINSSYYTWLGAKTVASLVSRAPVGFRFAIKLHKSITHEAEPNIEHGILATLEQNKPFGEPPVLLAQFPQRFKPSKSAINLVQTLNDRLANLVVEFRNREWQEESVVSQLSTISVCAVDEPRLPGLPRFSSINNGQIAYMRLHGRNAAKWHQHDKAYERYDYRYNHDELAEFVQPVLAMSAKAKEALVFFNNHYGAQAVDNARELATMLGMRKRTRQTKLEI